MDELSCKYISTYGFRRMCDVTSLDNGSGIGEYNFNNIKENGTLYIKLDKIPEFSKIINSINASFILVSGASDYTTPIDLFPSKEVFFEFINNKKILHWYCQNCISPHPKITLLPIGLDYHTLSFDNYYKWGNKAYPTTQENELISVKILSLPFWDRQIKAYSNFHFQMNTKFSYDRRDAINMINKEIVYYEPTEIKRIETWKNQINYAFVISPHGNGRDCHRLWEALVLGCIPIVRTSPLDQMYKDLPVLILNTWGDLNQELLEKTIISFKDKTFNYDKLTLKYWKNLIKSTK